MAEKYSTVILSTMCMIEDENGHILVQNRNKKDWPGITFPGGHVEQNETIEESVVREIKEETGLVISKLLLCGVMEWPWDNKSRYLAFIYKTKTFSGTIKNSEEGELLWIDKKDLFNYPLSQDMDAIFAIAEKMKY